MKGITGWGHKPYRPYNRAQEALLPFVCRLAPTETTVELEWFDHGCAGAHEVWFRPMHSEESWNRVPADAKTMSLTGLEENTEYELCVVRSEDESARSAVRFVRTGHAPGTVVNYLHPEDMLYAFSGRSLCSPSIVRLPSGALLASMDVYAGWQPQNLTLVYRSDDDGATWRYVTDLFPCFWPTIFVHQGRVYMFATSTEYGDIMIAETKDDGETWGKPSILFYGSGSYLTAGWQHTPMPFICHAGRICTCVDYGAWAEGGHSICVLSAPEDADLLASESWVVSEPVPYNPEWPGAPKGTSRGLLEGNMVVSPEGKLIDILRIQITQCEPNHGVAAALEADANDPEAPLTFHAFLNMPSGSNSKSHVLRDPETGAYFAIGNLCVDEQTPSQRNVLALQSSKDMVNWKIDKILLDYRDSDPAMVGFQYISFIFSGDDILYLSRTAINGAKDFHDANYQTFHRIENFRQYL